MKEMPVFIKIDEYKEIMDVMQVVKKKIKEARATISAIAEIKSREDAEIEDWVAKLAEIEKKSELVDRILFAPANE